MDDDEDAWDGPEGPEPVLSSVLGTRLAPKTVTRRNRLLNELEEFACNCGFSVGGIWSDVECMVEALRLYGENLFQKKRSRGDFVEAINAVATCKRAWRSLLTGAWDADRVWQLLQPGSHRVPMPVSVFKAGVVWALLTGRIEFAHTLLNGFFGGARPADFLFITRGNIILPSDLLDSNMDVYLVFDRPKNLRRGGARTEHVRLTDPLFTQFSEWACSLIPAPEDRVWPWGPDPFRRVWEQVFHEGLFLAVHGNKGFTPSSLRAGCATELYRQSGSLDVVQWHLRHSGARSLAHYIQELPRALREAKLSGQAAQRVALLAPHFDAAVADATLGVFGRGFRGGPLPRRRNAMLRREAAARKKERMLSILGSSLNDGGYWTKL